MFSKVRGSEKINQGGRGGGLGEWPYREVDNRRGTEGGSKLLCTMYYVLIIFILALFISLYYPPQIFLFYSSYISSFGPCF